jgi:hypothetical protein
MRQFTNSVAQALQAGNWYAALYLSLALPDICARLEADDGKTTSARYMTWFDRFLAARYRAIVGKREHVFLSANDCYSLRCAALHEGGSDISGQRLRQVISRFHFTALPGIHCNQFNSVLQLEVCVFCQDVCAAVHDWLAVFPSEHPDKVNRLQELLVVHEQTNEVAPGIVISTGAT